MPGIKKLLADLKVRFYIFMRFLQIISIPGEQRTTEKQSGKWNMQLTGDMTLASRCL